MLSMPTEQRPPETQLDASSARPRRGSSSESSPAGTSNLDSRPRTGAGVHFCHSSPRVCGVPLRCPEGTDGRGQVRFCNHIVTRTSSLLCVVI